jgi:hypothetical protein
MEKTELTADEKDELKGAIDQAKTYRNKKLKGLFLITVAAMTLGLSWSYWKDKLSWTMSLVILAMGLTMMTMFLLIWHLAGRQIKNLEKDLTSGIKKTGISKISTINFFNRTIKLVDGTIVYENELLNERWLKGDTIFYRATLSGDHLFECRKATN